MYQFIYLFIFPVILCSNKEFKRIPTTHIEEVIKRWLRYEPDRNGGRMERLEKSVILP